MRSVLFLLLCKPLSFSLPFLPERFGCRPLPAGGLLPSLGRIPSRFLLQESGTIRPNRMHGLLSRLRSLRSHKPYYFSSNIMSSILWSNEDKGTAFHRQVPTPGTELTPTERIPLPRVEF
jgi:hypothetical protein